MSLPKFLEVLADGLLVGDGAYGTMFYANGLPLQIPCETLNLTDPEKVAELHTAYLRAGARVIETNTYGANRLKLLAAGWEEDGREINRRGAEIARNVAQDKAFVAGSVGPLGKREPLAPDAIYDIYREQVEALAEGGIDLFLLETFSSWEEIREALRAVKNLTDLPAVAQMAFIERARTGAGVSAAEAARTLRTLGADVVGANCGAGPREALRTATAMREIGPGLLSAYPNAGFPEYQDGRLLYLSTPEYLAESAARLVEAGASLVGGCCGTTPADIAAIAERVRGLKPRLFPAAALPLPPTAATPAPRPFIAEGPKGRITDKVGKKTIWIVELTPPKSMKFESLLESARELLRAGVDAVSLSQNPLASVRLGNVAMGYILQKEVGMTAVVHITCRDYNLIGLQSELMGASALGIKHILALTGDPAFRGEHTGSSSVYDLNSFKLVELIVQLNRGTNAIGASIGRPTDFTIGAAMNPNVPNLDGEIKRLEKKVAAGAQYAQTQPVYSLPRIIELYRKTAHLGIPIILGMIPLASYRNAEFLHAEFPGIEIPPDIRDRMCIGDKEREREEGIAIAAETLAAVKGFVPGFYIVPPFNRFSTVIELMKRVQSMPAGPIPEGLKPVLRENSVVKA